jgi:penicillin-binding protein A
VNTPLRRAALFCLVLFGLLAINANYLQVVKAEEYRNKSGNRRLVLEEYSRERGAILVEGRPIAFSTPTPADNLKYLRRYADGPMYAPVTGFYSPVYGSGGVEGTESSLLAGTDDRLFVRRVVDMLTGKQSRGGNVSLTLNSRAQRAAYEGLAGKKGAAVAIEPATGRILAMVSSPSYDPNKLATHDASEVTEAWNRIQKDGDKPAVNRAMTRLYPPGSTFKVVTAAAALTSGKFAPDTVVSGPAAIRLPKTNINLGNENGKPCGDGQPTLQVALEFSCNTVFASLGMTVGARALQDQAERFGFNDRVRIPMPSSQSVFPPRIDEPQTALSSIGQFEVKASPLQMAMVVAAVANRGTLMKPYLVEEVRAPNLSRVEQTSPEPLRESVTPDVAAQLRQMMVSVVDQGTGKRAQIPGVSVGGKTGTAQHVKGAKPHAWFVSFAPADDPKVAVAVVVEDGAENRNDISGGRLAAPVAKAMMEAVISR